MADRHPKLSLAYVLAVLLGHKVLYRVSSQPTGFAVVMTAALLLSAASSLAAASKLTGFLVTAVFLPLAVIWAFDQMRMKRLVATAHDVNLEDGSI